MPLISNSNSIFDISDITQVLQTDPDLKSSFRSNKRDATASELEDIRQILNRNSGSIEDASSVITEVMHNSKFDNTRIKAAEIVLDLHEVRDKEGRLNKQPVINFNIISDEVKIANIFTPHKMRKISEIGEE